MKMSLKEPIRGLILITIGGTAAILETAAKAVAVAAGEVRREVEAKVQRINESRSTAE